MGFKLDFQSYKIAQDVVLLFKLHFIVLCSSYELVIVLLQDKKERYVGSLSRSNFLLVSLIWYYSTLPRSTPPGLSQLERLGVTENYLIIDAIGAGSRCRTALSLTTPN